VISGLWVVDGEGNFGGVDFLKHWDEEILATELTVDTELERVLSAVCPRKNLLKKASFYHKF